MAWLLLHTHVYTPRNRANIDVYDLPLSMSHFHLCRSWSQQNILVFFEEKLHLNDPHEEICSFWFKAKDCCTLYFTSAASQNTRGHVKRWTAIKPQFSSLKAGGRKFSGIMQEVNQIPVMVLTPSLRSRAMAGGCQTEPAHWLRGVSAKEDKGHAL